MSWTDGVAVRAVWVRRRGSRLLVPFDPPALDISAVIDRRWHPGPWSLLVPIPVAERYLPTYPMPAWESADGVNWFPHDSRPRIVTVGPLGCYL